MIFFKNLNAILLAIFMCPIMCSYYYIFLLLFTDFIPVGLLDMKPEFLPQARHQNKIQKVFLRRYPLIRFLAKILRVNKIAIKSSSKHLYVCKCNG